MHEAMFFAMFVDADGNEVEWEDAAIELGDFCDSMEFYQDVSFEFHTCVYNDDDTHVRMNADGDYVIIVGV